MEDLEGSEDSLPLQQEFVIAEPGNVCTFLQAHVRLYPLLRPTYNVSQSSENYFYVIYVGLRFTAKTCTENEGTFHNTLHQQSKGKFVRAPYLCLLYKHEDKQKSV